MKKTMVKITAFLTLTVLLASCYPGGDVSISDLDTVTTFYEPTNFNPPPSSIVIYWNVAQLLGEDGNDIPYDNEIDDEILNTTLENLVDLYGVNNVLIYSQDANPVPAPSVSGVTIIGPNDPDPNVDMTLIPSIVLRANTDVSIIYPPCIPDYWWGWYCYPPYIDISSYDIGTVMLSMVDIRNGFQNQDPSWLALIRGLLSSSEGTNSTRTIEGINQAFSQSSYLN